MKILIIGGTGHVGTFLTRKLLSQGHEVYIGTRGKHSLREGGFFEGAKFVTCDAGNKDSLEALKAYQFDTVVDFPGTAYHIWQVLGDTISHLVACGSLWMFGYPHKIPTPEMTQEECPFEGYKQRYEQILEMLKESGKGKATFTAVMPPNICGPGKVPLDSMGGRDVERHKSMMRGETVILPDGPECMVGPCDAEDIASLFALAVNNREAAAGQIFNAGSAYALPAGDFIKAYGDIYGVEIPVKRVSWKEYSEAVNPKITAWWHFYAHMQPDISKAKELLGYEPQYTPEEAMKRAVDWMRQEGML